MNVEIHPYREAWPLEFRAIATALRQALGSVADRIDHIGSTAVPGLAAKDVIDIQVSVPELAPEVKTALVAIGYTWAEAVCRDHQPPGCSCEAVDWQKWFFRPPTGQRKTNVHVRVARRANQRYALLFRDYLRAHPASALAYGQLKQALAAGLRDPQDYPDVKDPAVDLIFFAAEAWAATVHWQPSTTDA